MKKNYTSSVSKTVAAALVAAGASTAIAAPAQAAPEFGQTDRAVVQYQGDGSGSLESLSASGSLEEPLVQAGLLLVVGLGVSAGLAIAAGFAGGAFNDLV